MYTLSLEVVNKCNLNCSYCYLGEKKNTFMSLDTAKKAIDIAVHETKKQYDKKLVVYFIGGEPLLAFELIYKAVLYTKEKCSENALDCEFSTTINGTLLTEKIADFFIQHVFTIKLSLDGDEYVHDLNRKDYGGKGSFRIIMEKIPYLKKYEKETGKEISVASVITQNNYMFYGDSFQFLLDMGCKKIESGIDYYSPWKEGEIKGLKDQLDVVFQKYKNHIQRTREPIFWNLWEQYLRSYLIPCEFYACKAGLTTVYVTTDGGIYTCLEMPEFRIGHVNEGLNVPIIREIVYRSDNPSAECMQCKYKSNCKTRGCQAANFELNHNIYEPIKVNCEVTKHMYELIESNLTGEQQGRLRKEYERRIVQNGKKNS